MSTENHVLSTDLEDSRFVAPIFLRSKQVQELDCESCLRPRRIGEGENVYSDVMVHCAECGCVLCLDCFSFGMEPGKHKREHAYRLLPAMDSPVLDDSWRADEEMRLLASIERYGVGNWQQVAEIVRTKPRAECERHYYECYLATEDKMPVKASKHKKHVAVPMAPHPDPEKGKLPSELHASLLNSADVLGFNVKRRDFDFEYKQTFEHHLKEIEFYDDDEEEAKQLKEQIMREYWRVLQARKIRREFLFQRGLEALKTPPRLSPPERDIWRNLKPLARFQSPAEHDALFRGLVEEMHLRRRIRELQRMREAGFKNLAEGNRWLESNFRQQPARRATRGLQLRSLVDLTDAERQMVEKYTLPRVPVQRRRISAAQLRPASTAHEPAPVKEETQELRPQMLAPKDFSHEPEFHQLPAEERKLCALLHMPPRDWLTVRNCVLNELVQKGLLTEEMTTAQLQLAVHKSHNCIDVVVSHGWDAAVAVEGAVEVGSVQVPLLDDGRPDASRLQLRTASAAPKADSEHATDDGQMKDGD
ncbi:MAG: hypothetical protein MHM6MM_006823 [Cercozoa sp. M6MM]